MDDALAVRSGERGGDLTADAQGVDPKRTAQALDAARERLPVAVLHDDIGGAVRQLAIVEAADDAGVGDYVDRPRLVEKAGNYQGVLGILRAQDFDRYMAADSLVHSLKDAAHAAVADLADDFIMPDELSDHDAPPGGQTNPL